MQVNKYRLTIKHDNGKFNVVTAATSESAAIHIVSCAECCPLTAIIKVKLLNK